VADVRRVALAVVGLVAVSACSGGGSSTPTAGAAAPTPPSPAAAPATASPADTASRAPSDTAPQAPAPTVPAKTAGPLTGRDLPRASALGAGWRSFADPGNAEEGYVGNGSPVYRREPAELLRVILPLGCLHRAALPAPTYALAEDYRSGARAATAMRLRFASAEQARVFFRTWSADLRRCARQGTDAMSGAAAPVAGVTTSRGVLVSERLDATDDSGVVVPWTEAKVVRGRDLLLLSQQGRVPAAALVAAVDRAWPGTS
jgi:hypothetical protein